MAQPAGSLKISTDSTVAQMLAQTHGPVKWFQITAVTRIQGGIAEPSRIHSAVAAVCKEISTRTDRQPYDFGSELEHHARAQGSKGRQGDLQPWAATISSDPGAVAGVHRISQGINESGPASYAVVYHGHSQQATELFGAMVAEKPELTVHELVNSQEYRQARLQAVRNAQRITAQIGAGIAALQDKPITMVMRVRPDELSARVASDPTAAPDMLAEPDYMHMTNYIETDRVTPTVKSAHYNTGALFHHGTVDPNVSSHLIGQLAVADGFYVRDLKPSDGVQTIMSALERSSPAENVTFTQAKQTKGIEAVRNHTRATFVTGQGLPPSSNSRPLWMYESHYTPKQGDMRLTPVAVYINGTAKTV